MNYKETILADLKKRYDEKGPENYVLADTLHGFTPGDPNYAIAVNQLLAEGLITGVEGPDKRVAIALNPKGVERMQAFAQYNVTYVEAVNMTESGPITTISQTGSGTMTIGTISQAGRDLIEESKKHVRKIKDTKLKDAMEQLTKLVETLAAKAPDAVTQEEAAKKLKQLTEEASSSKPDGEILKVTSEGLVDAAKTVASMAGPIATAVEAVLALLV